MSDPTHDIFAWRDAYLAEHPEIVQAMKACAWYEWAQRQILGIRIIEQVWRDGQLVSERDVTPDDPEPEL